MSEKFLEQSVGDSLLRIVAEEAEYLENLDKRDAGDIGRLVNICRSFQILMANVRENRKAGLFADSSDADLRAMAGEEVEEELAESEE
jgi:hypothetical protein